MREPRAQQTLLCMQAQSDAHDSREARLAQACDKLSELEYARAEARSFQDQAELQERTANLDSVSQAQVCKVVLLNLICYIPMWAAGAVVTALSL